MSVCIRDKHCQSADLAAKGVMCPSFRVTGDLLDSPGGRVEVLKDALNGLLGDAPFAAARVREALDLCVGCKGCKRECANQVDMAALKIEALAQRNAASGVPWRDRLFAALRPALAAGTPVVGLEPSCILSLRDEHLKLGLGPDAVLLAKQVWLFEEFLAREADRKRFAPAFKPLPRKALVHGHCHQKAVGAMKSLRKVLRMVPELEFEFIEASCCGMAGNFGLEVEHAEISMQMAEAALLPAIRAATPETDIVANGFSCRHQIEEGSGRAGRHVALLLQEALP